MRALGGVLLLDPGGFRRSLGFFFGGSVNKVILIGNVGKEPEIRTTKGGTTIANCSLATSERVKRGDEWQEETSWHNLVLFGRTAEVVSQYVQKGGKIAVEGRIQYRSWEDKEGNKRYTTEIVVDRLELLGSKGGGTRHEPRREEDRGGEHQYDEDPPF